MEKEKEISTFLAALSKSRVSSFYPSAVVKNTGSSIKEANAVLEKWLKEGKISAWYLLMNPESSEIAKIYERVEDIPFGEWFDEVPFGEGFLIEEDLMNIQYYFTPEQKKSIESNEPEARTVRVTDSNYPLRVFLTKNAPGEPLKISSSSGSLVALPIYIEGLRNLLVDIEKNDHVELNEQEFLKLVMPEFHEYKAQMSKERNETNDEEREI